MIETRTIHVPKTVRVVVCDKCRRDIEEGEVNLCQLASVRKNAADGRTEYSTQHKFHLCFMCAERLRQELARADRPHEPYVTDEEQKSLLKGLFKVSR